jgi:hypothetical protein
MKPRNPRRIRARLVTADEITYDAGLRSLGIQFIRRYAPGSPNGHRDYERTGERQGRYWIYREVL